MADAITTEIGPAWSDPMRTHALYNDPPQGLTGGVRLTCDRCGRAALTLGRFWYGSAMSTPCTVAASDG